MRIYHIDLFSSSQMQRIVITSSISAIMSLPVSKPTVFSEHDWNMTCHDVKKIQENGFTAYLASKTRAEKGGVFLNIFLSFGLPLTCFFQSAAWDFYEQHKSQIKWDLAVINPPFVSCFFALQKKTSPPTVTNCPITGVRGEQ